VKLIVSLALLCCLATPVAATGSEIIEPDITVIAVTSLPDVAEEATSTMADVITGVLGEYRQKTYTVEHLDAEGNVIATSVEYVPGLAGLDYAWLAGAAVFLLFFSGSFRLLGGLIRS